MFVRDDVHSGLVGDGGCPRGIGLDRSDSRRSLRSLGSLGRTAASNALQLRVGSSDRRGLGADGRGGGGGGFVVGGLRRRLERHVGGGAAGSRSAEEGSDRRRRF